MSQTLEQLRVENKWREYFEKLLSSEDKKSIRQQVVGDSCPLLEYADWARANNRSLFVISLLNINEESPLIKVFLDDPSCLRTLFPARLRLMQAYLKGDSEQSKEAIRDFASAVEESWQYEPSHYSRNVHYDLTSKKNQISGLSYEPSSITALSNEKVKEHFREVVNGDDEHLGIGWTSPGLLMAGETIALLEGFEHRAKKLRGETRLMLAFNNRKDFPRGVLPKLILERIPNGCGLLIPHPRSTGYLGMAKNFSDSLQVAWKKIRSRFARPDFDWRWSLHLGTAVQQTFDDEELKEMPLVMDVEGRSAEVAIACALWAVHPQNRSVVSDLNPLDPAALVSAQFESSSESDDKLNHVEEMKTKILNNASQDVQYNEIDHERIQRIFIAENHPESDLPDLRDGIKFPRVRTFDEAYEALSRRVHIADVVKRGLQRDLEEVEARLADNPQFNTADEIILAKIPQGIPLAEQSTIASSSLIRTSISEIAKEFLSTESQRSTERPLCGPRIRLFAPKNSGKSHILLQLSNEVLRSNTRTILISLGRTFLESIRKFCSVFRR